MEGLLLRGLQRAAAYLIYVVSLYILQYFLSTRENRWLGWILPLRYFLTGMVSAASPDANFPVVTAFLLGGGIHCAIHIIIYCIGRKMVRQRMADRVEKMNIQDLG